MAVWYREAEDNDCPLGDPGRDGFPSLHNTRDGYTCEYCGRVYLPGIKGQLLGVERRLDEARAEIRELEGVLRAIGRAWEVPTNPTIND